MGNTVTRSHIRDADPGVAKATRANTKKNSTGFIHDPTLTNTASLESPLPPPNSAAVHLSTSSNRSLNSIYSHKNRQQKHLVPEEDSLPSFPTTLSPPTKSMTTNTIAHQHSNTSSSVDDLGIVFSNESRQQRPYRHHSIPDSSQARSKFPENRHSFTYGSQRNLQHLAANTTSEDIPKHSHSAQIASASKPPLPPPPHTTSISISASGNPVSTFSSTRRRERHGGANISFSRNSSSHLAPTQLVPSATLQKKTSNDRHEPLRDHSRSSSVASRGSPFKHRSPANIDPNLPGGTVYDCQTARTQTPPRVDKPPRARKVVSFNENVHVVTYQNEGSSTHSSVTSDPPVSRYIETKQPKRRARSVFRLLSRVTAPLSQQDQSPFPGGVFPAASCFSTPYDTCCGLRAGNAEMVYDDSAQIIKSTNGSVEQTRNIGRRSNCNSSRGLPDDTETGSVVSYERARRTVEELASQSSRLDERLRRGTVADDFDYNERQSSDEDDTLSLSDAHPSRDGIDEPEAIGDQLLSPPKDGKGEERINSAFDIIPLWQRLKRVDELDVAGPSKVFLINEKPAANRGVRTPDILMSNPANVVLKKAAVKQDGVERDTSEKSVSEQHNAEREVLKEEISHYRSSKQGLLEKVAAKLIVSEEVISELVISEHATSEQVIAEPVNSEHANSNKVSSKLSASERVVSEQVISEQIISQNVNSPQFISEHIISEQVMEEHVISDHDISEQVMDEHVISDRDISEQVIPEPIADHMFSEGFSTHGSESNGHRRFTAESTEGISSAETSNGAISEQDKQVQGDADTRECHEHISADATTALYTSSGVDLASSSEPQSAADPASDVEPFTTTRSAPNLELSADAECCTRERIGQNTSLQPCPDGKMIQETQTFLSGDRRVAGIVMEQTPENRPIGTPRQVNRSADSLLQEACDLEERLFAGSGSTSVQLLGEDIRELSSCQVNDAGEVVICGTLSTGENPLALRMPADGRGDGVIGGLDLDPICLSHDDYSVAACSPAQSPLAGVFYGNYSPPQHVPIYSDDGAAMTGLADYPEYAVLKGQGIEDSAFGSDPDTPIMQTNLEWNEPFNEFELGGQFQDESIPLRHVTYEDRLPKLAVPEVLLHDWSGSIPVEPNVEIVDSAPNSRSSVTYMPSSTSRTTEPQQDIRNAALLLSARLNIDISKLRTKSATDDVISAEDSVEPSIALSAIDGRNRRGLSTSMRRVGNQSSAVGENSKGEREFSANRESSQTQQSFLQRKPALGSSLSSQNMTKSSTGGSGETTGTCFASVADFDSADPKLRDFQMSVERKSFSEMGYRSAGLDSRGRSFVDADHNGEPVSDFRTYSGNPEKHEMNNRRLTPQRRRRMSNMEMSEAIQEDGGNNPFRNVMERLVGRMQIGKKLGSSS